MMTRGKQSAKTSTTEKERRQQTVIGVAFTVIVVITLALIGVLGYKASRPKAQVSTADAYAALQQVKEKPANATDKGGIAVSVDGAPKTNVPTIENYVDPLCPACAQVDHALNSVFEELFNAGQINFEIHPLSFLDKASSDKYSSRASSALLYIAEHDPKHLVIFMQNLYAKDYQPSESGYQPTSDDRIMQQAIKAGVLPKIAKKAMSGQYEEWVEKSTTYTINRKELQDPARGSEGFATPLIRINKHIWSMAKLNLIELPARFTDSLGLSTADVGNAEVMPSIGATGKPL